MIPEISDYLASIERQRARVFAALEQAPPEAWNWRPTRAETNSLFVLATHVIGAEQWLILELIGGAAATRNRPAEFVATANPAAPAQTLDALRAEYERVASETRALFERLTAADLTSTRHRAGQGDVSVRWIILRVIEHSSEHLGHMELTKQLWEDSKIAQ